MAKSGMQKMKILLVMKELLEKQTRIIQSLFLNWFLCWEEMGLRQNEKAYTTTLRL